MQQAVVTLAIIVTVMAGCMQPGARSENSGAAGWTPSTAPLEPEALRPAAAPSRNDLVVLLPKPDGAIGGIVVRAGGRETVLNRAYAGLHIGGPGVMQPVVYDARRTQEEFAGVVSALPGRPATFLLYFLEGRDALTPESEREVERIVAAIAARPHPEILVIGHTDALGHAQFNDQLSRQRAQRVRDDLVVRGIPLHCIEVSGRGKREPLIRTPDGAPEPRNRRVEINVR